MLNASLVGNDYFSITENAATILFCTDVQIYSKLNSTMLYHWNQQYKFNRTTQNDPTQLPNFIFSKSLFVSCSTLCTQMCTTSFKFLCRILPCLPTHLIPFIWIILIMIGVLLCLSLIWKAKLQTTLLSLFSSTLQLGFNRRLINFPHISFLG